MNLINTAELMDFFVMEGMMDILKILFTRYYSYFPLNTLLTVRSVCTVFKEQAKIAARKHLFQLPCFQKYCVNNAVWEISQKVDMKQVTLLSTFSWS